jgi:hypothetical protein
LWKGLVPINHTQHPQSSWWRWQLIGTLKKLITAKHKCTLYKKPTLKCLSFSLWQ